MWLLRYSLPCSSFLFWQHMKIVSAYGYVSFYTPSSLSAFSISYTFFMSFLNLFSCSNFTSTTLKLCSIICFTTVIPTTRKKPPYTKILKTKAAAEWMIFIPHWIPNYFYCIKPNYLLRFHLQTYFYSYNSTLLELPIRSN